MAALQAILSELATLNELTKKKRAEEERLANTPPRYLRPTMVPSTHRLF